MKEVPKFHEGDHVRNGEGDHDRLSDERYKLQEENKKLKSIAAESIDAAIKAEAELADLRARMEPLEGECNLGKESLGDQCCCICKFLLTDYWHCTRMPEELKPEGKCGCQVVRGYICTANEIYEGDGGSSGWPHHSIGCECFEERQAIKAGEGK